MFCIGIRERSTSSFANNFREFMKRDELRNTSYALDANKMNDIQAKWKRKIEKERDELIDMIIDR